jgi:hypothetical protein
LTDGRRLPPTGAKISMTKIVTSFCVVLLTLSAMESRATESVKRLLYVGNSFYSTYNSLHGHVNRPLAGALPKAERDGMQSYSVTISGGQLKWHNIGAYPRRRYRR